MRININFGRLIPNLLYAIIPDSLYAIIMNMYLKVSPHRPGAVISHRGDMWSISYGNETFFSPNPKLAVSLIDGKYQQYKYERYIFPPHVTIEEGDIVCDVGSYVGGFTLPASEKAEKVYAFEPDPLNYTCLKKNTKSLPNVQTVKIALWNSDGEKKLKIGHDRSDSSLLNVDKGEEINSILIQTRRLDNYLEEENIKKIDFLKVHGEGAEPEILEGASNFLGKISKIAVSCDFERFGASPLSNVQEFLDTRGFQTQAVDNVVFAWKE